MKPVRLLVLLLAACAGATALDTLRLEPGERILIVAPHPDDEVVACGGLIQQALASGDSVWVVYLTNGDGAWLSAAEVTGRLFPRPADYIALGRARMLEARRATALLGLDSSRLTFLGYPDGDLAGLWSDNWDRPRESGRTATDVNPYGTGREYTGRNLFDDLVETIRQLRPDRVFAPHECDAHPDHWAAAGFLALTRAAWRDRAAFPVTYGYHIHRRPWRGSNAVEDGPLAPPPRLRGDRHRWLTLPLTRQQSTRKAAAYEENKSQHNLTEVFLSGFAGPREFFDLQAESDSLVLDDAPTPWALRTNRLDTLVATRADRVVFRVRLEAGPSKLFSYRMVLHAVNDAGSAVTLSRAELEADVQNAEPDVLTTAAPRPTSGILFFSLEVRRGSRLINHTGMGRIVF